MNDIEQLSILYESLDITEDFMLDENEKDFIDKVYSFPILFPTSENLEKLRDVYLKEYLENSEEIEKLIPLDHFNEFYFEIKDTMRCNEEDLALPEYTDSDLIENGFYESTFVIHEHNATTFHWDLRWKTRFGNSAYSFAIPKAKLPESADKILAIRQPMHPAIWVDLKETDTFKEDTQRGAMGSIKLIDRGKVYVKERPRSFIVFLEGSIYKGAYILINTNNSNSYMLMKTDKIISDKDARSKEWRVSAQKYWNYQKSKILELFGFNCDDTKLVFENDDASIDYSGNDDKGDNAYEYILVPTDKSDEIKMRRKANPNRIPEQCQADSIASSLGNFVWNVKLDDSNRTDAYNALRRVDFDTPYLKLQEKVTNADLFNEAFSCTLTGRKMFKDTNLELLFKNSFRKMETPTD